MAVRDARTNKARAIPQLIIENEDEQALWDMGAEQKERKKQLASMSLERQPPNQEETAVRTLPPFFFVPPRL
jgi:acyl-coenzyme A thioesterase 9